MNKIKIHLRGIDGLRAIMSIAVVVSHTMQSSHMIGLAHYPDGLDLAGFGVTIFFTLSGFLITYLLILEKEKKEINILNFYLRRVLRIWPLYFFYLLVALFVSYQFGYKTNANQLLFYVLFIPNFLHQTIPETYHYWSLGVEEQFYLFWPWLMKMGKNLLFVSIVFFLVFLVVKFYARYIEYQTGDEAFYKIMLWSRFNCMAIGAMGGILYHSGNAFFIRIGTHLFTQLACWSLYAAILMNQYHFFTFIDNEIVSVATVMIIVAQITQTNRVLNLDLPLLSYLGKISFGIYIYHPLIIFLFFKYVDFTLFHLITQYFLAYGGVLGITVLISSTSYAFLESPFLRIKERYSSNEK